MLTLTSPVETWSHKLPAGPKMAVLCVFSAGLFGIAGGLPMLFAAAAVAGLVLTCGVAFAQTSARMLKPLWPFVLIVTLWHLWLRDPSGGAIIILRLIAAVAAANFVTMTTRLSDMIDVLTRIIRPLSVVGLSPRIFGLAVALVIRFIPVMLLRVQTITESWRARSARRPGWRILVPALLAALDDAEYVAEALRARGGAG